MTVPTLAPAAGPVSSAPLPPTPVVTLHDVELAAVGFWSAATGPTLLTEAEMQSMVAAANDPEVDAAPAHPGHFDPRFPRLADGEPALGWVKPKRVFGGKLIGDLVDVPAALAGPMLKAFSRRSVEYARNITTPSGRFYPAALTGLGMLGITAPAVKGLADVAARYVYAGAAIPAGGPEIVALEVSDTPQVRYGVAALVAMAGHDGRAPTHQEDRPVARFSDSTVRELLGLAQDADVTAIQAQIAAGAPQVQVPAGLPAAPAPVVAPASPAQIVPGQQVAVMPDGTVVPIPGTAPAAPAGAAPAPAQLTPGQQPPAAAPPAVPAPQQVAASALPIAPPGWAYNAQLQLVPAGSQTAQAPTFPAAPALPAPVQFAAAPAPAAAPIYQLDPRTGQYVPVAPAPAAAPPAPPAALAAGNPLVTQLSAGMLTELQTRAVRGDVAMGMLEEQQREQILTTALGEGRLAAAEVPAWREQLRTNLAGAWQLLQSLTPNRVPTAAVGTPAALSTGSPAAHAAADEAFAAWERATFPDIAAAHAAASA